MLDCFTINETRVEGTMSSHPLDEHFGRALQMIDAAWRAVAAAEKKCKERNTMRVRASLPVPNPAWRFELKYQGDGAASVRINDLPHFTLSPKLGRLLEILAADRDRCPDGTVGWKSVAEVTSELIRDGGPAKFTQRALNQLLYRLRLSLASHGVHPGLIQYHRTKRAFRFFLRL